MNVEYTCPMGNDVCHCYETDGFVHKNEIIEIIYNKISDKTFNRGCKFKYRSMYGNDVLTIIDYTDDGILIYENEVGEKYEEVINEWDIDKFQIIGNLVTIGDVLEYIGRKTYLDNNDGKEENNRYHYMNIIDLWENKRLPIENQSDKCILYVYNLIKD